MTLRANYTKGLENLGYRLDIRQTSKKYLILVKHGASPTYFFLGKAGSVRYGSIKRVDASVSATELTKQRLIGMALIGP
ncbi:MAG: hypothetical protein ABTQ25_02470 [Nitrosomonas ureae]